MNRPQRNNNPGNLDFRGQTGSVLSEDGRCAKWPDAPSGWRGLIRQIQKDQGRGETIEQFCTRFAPPVENDTEDYIKFLCSGLHDVRTTLLSTFSPYALAGMVAAREGYFAPG